MPPKIRSWTPAGELSQPGVAKRAAVPLMVHRRHDLRLADTAFLTQFALVRPALQQIKHEGQSRTRRTCCRPGRRHRLHLLTGRACEAQEDFQRAASQSRVKQWPRTTMAVDRFRTTMVAWSCNLIAGGFSLTFTADIARHAGTSTGCPPTATGRTATPPRSDERVTVGHVLADGTLDGFIAELLEAKLRLDEALGRRPPDTSVLDDFYAAKLRSLGPALMLENSWRRLLVRVRERLSRAKLNTGIAVRRRRNQIPMPVVSCFQPATRFRRYLAGSNRPVRLPPDLAIKLATTEADTEHKRW